MLKVYDMEKNLHWHLDIPYLEYFEDVEKILEEKGLFRERDLTEVEKMLLL